MMITVNIFRAEMELQRWKVLAEVQVIFLILGENVFEKYCDVQSFKTFIPW
jgi:hypothetical protein